MSTIKKNRLGENLLSKFENFNFSKQLISELESSKQEISIKILHGSAKAIITALINKNISLPLFILTDSIQSAEDWYHDLSLMLETEKISTLTHKHRSQNIADHESEISSIIDAISKISTFRDSICISTPDIFEVKIPNPDSILNSKIKISVNETIDFNDFTADLMLNGFQREVYVSEAGEISIRGGIVDIFPIGWDNPLRIEFWGDEIDSIREFDPVSQRSIREHKSVEFISKLVNNEDDSDLTTIYTFLPNDLLFVIDNPNLIDMDSTSLLGIEKFRKLTINPIGSADIQIKSSPQPLLDSSILKLNHEIRSLASRDIHLFIGSDSQIHRDRLKDLLENAISNYDESENDNVTIDFEKLKNNISWASESLSSGFILAEDRIAFFSENQVFGRRRIKDSKKKKSAESITLKELKQLQIGDYVVHEDKGIGRFDGFQTIEISGSKQDCVRMIFSEGDVLYVTLNYIHKVQKFSASEGVVPKLSKLGSTEWLRKKEKTKRKLKDIAKDLIELYAARKKSKGYAYPIDDIWQKEFEASFMYEDTLDQAKTTEDVKKDMESEVPMDRLVCGDVGFGKTEIAVRAAFKAAQAGKQSAVLVPTTVLAQQHFMTFKDRISRYPVTVDVISRFRTKKEQDEVLNKLKNGKLDILIGTHRLLSKDIEFKDLGLLIIDEEHRFGVGAKEKLRQIKASIDTLTLTATPIPRTLNFSLMGARDLSLIETPPRNRLPVETEIIDWIDDDIVEIIDKELNRGGQVFFVNDKIDGLDKIANDLKMRMPYIKYGIAHGQMAPAELEKVMEKFVQRKIDILFATKIVESGLDIPNANTMIINNANNFGLAELYQLRGRVGRSSAQGFCFLVVHRIGRMPMKALQRLQAIEEFTDLGSGLKLAMRDLEIRGAGNLLGPEQSGFINEIGFDLFHKILDEAVQELKASEFKEVFKDDINEDVPLFKNDDISIELYSDAFLPSDYIENDTDRFEYYKKLYKTETNKDLELIIEELSDRFGKLPRQAKELIFAVKLRIASLNTGFTRIILGPEKLTADFPDAKDERYYKLAFPHVVEYLNTLAFVSLKQTKTKLVMQAHINDRNQAIELMWKIKKTIETLDTDY